MSQYSIENDAIRIKVNKKGAEMCELMSKSDETHFLWTADKNYWGRHAPVLFPIVGQVQDGKYEIDGKAYELSQHGFARDMEFELVEASETRLILSLTSNEDTRKKYPYEFELRIGYEIIGSRVDVTYEVINLDEDTIWFSIGAHPGFNCPLFTDRNFSDYYIEFEQAETSDKLEFASGLLSGTSKPFLKNQKQIRLSSKLFEEDALIFENLNSRFVDLKCDQDSQFLRFYFEGFPFFAIWSPPGKQAPFVCLEPWFGITDTLNANLDYRNKKGIQKLSKGGTFSCTHSMEIRKA